MRQSWKWPALMAVVLPGGIVIAAAWLMSRYLGERGAAAGRAGAAGRGERWDWPQSRGRGGQWGWPRSHGRAGRWNWPTGDEDAGAGRNPARRSDA